LTDTKEDKPVDKLKESEAAKEGLPVLSKFLMEPVDREAL
jgi:hypothetical protein